TVVVPRPLDLFLAVGRPDFAASVQAFLPFTAGFTGNLTLSQSNGDALFAFDGVRQLLGASSGSSSLELSVEAGELYFVAVVGTENAGFPERFEVSFLVDLPLGSVGLLPLLEIDA